MDQTTSLDKLCIKVGFDFTDHNLVCAEIQNSYWALGRPRDLIEKSLKNSLCFSLFLNSMQVGFARVVTDFATFAYLCDVFVLKGYQSRGFGKLLMTSVMEYPELASVKWLLRTKDAHGLYEQFGFKKTHRPDRYMEKYFSEERIS